jgi:hypothetical protein
VEFVAADVVPLVTVFVDPLVTAFVTAFVVLFATAFDTVFVVEVIAPAGLLDTALVAVLVVVAPRVFALVLVVLAANAFATLLMPVFAKLLVTTDDVPRGAIKVGLNIFVVVAVPEVMLTCDGTAYGSFTVIARL